MIPKYRQNRM